MDVETFTGVTGEANKPGDGSRCCGDMIIGHSGTKQTEKLLGMFPSLLGMRQGRYWQPN